MLALVISALFVIPAKAGIHFDLVFLFLEPRLPLACGERVTFKQELPCSSAARVTFLCSCKEKSPKETRPRCRARTMKPCEFASPGRGSLDVRPCTFANGRASCAPSCRTDPPCSRRDKGGPKSKAGSRARSKAVAQSRDGRDRGTNGAIRGAEHRRLWRLKPTEARARGARVSECTGMCIKRTPPQTRSAGDFAAHEAPQNTSSGA